MTAARALFVAWPLLALGLGCSIAPKSFRGEKGSSNPAPLVRARALGLGRAMPQSLVVPHLIDRLGDPDRVVRLTANEELKRRTGQDFGYVAWGDNVERQQAIDRWKAWWAAGGKPPVQPSPQQQVARARPRRRWR